MLLIQQEFTLFNKNIIIFAEKLRCISINLTSGEKKKKEKEILFVCQWYQDNILTELCVIDPTSATVEETENMTLSCVIYHTSTLLILISVFIPPPCYCSSM